MTYIVSGGALNSTHSLTHFYSAINNCSHCAVVSSKPVSFQPRLSTITSSQGDDLAHIWAENFDHLFIHFVNLCGIFSPDASLCARDQCLTRVASIRGPRESGRVGMGRVTGKILHNLC